MKSVSGRKLAKMLEKHGWKLLRIQGSHHIYGKKNSEIRVSVPIHGDQDLKIGLVKHILKISGIDEKEFD